MAISTAPFTIHFPDWFDERAEFEMEAKGYFPDITVELEDGHRFRLYFYDPVRLGQDLEAASKFGRPYRTEPNLVVIPEVTPAAIEQAVAGLVRDRFFDHLKPLAPESPR